MTFTDEQKKEFDDKGFIVMKSFFDKQTMDKVSAWLDELRDKLPGEGKEAKYYEKSTLTGENILIRIENVLRGLNPEMRRLLLTKNTIDCLTDLFGEPPLLVKEKIN